MFPVCGASLYRVSCPLPIFWIRYWLKLPAICGKCAAFNVLSKSTDQRKWYNDHDKNSLLLNLVTRASDWSPVVSSVEVFLPSATKLRRLCFYRRVSVHREGVPDQVHPPGPGTPPGTRYTPWGQVHPPEPGTSPGTRYTPWAGTPHRAGTPLGRYTPPRPGTPPRAGTPPRQVHPPDQAHPPRQVHPPGRYTPPDRYPLPGQVPPPQAGTPPDQVHPPETRYTPWQVHPPGRYTPSNQVHPHLEIRPTLRTVRILLECILPSSILSGSIFCYFSVPT